VARVRDAFPILLVADLERSLAFYRDRLGFAVAYTFEGFAQLEVEGGRLGLARTDERVEPASTAIWAYTDDVDALFAELTAAGAPAVAEPADRPWGERVASVADPDGYVVHLGAEA
jgi:lactoylglutathione lyase